MTPCLQCGKEVERQWPKPTDPHCSPECLEAHRVRVQLMVDEAHHITVAPKLSVPSRRGRPGKYVYQASIKHKRTGEVVAHVMGRNPCYLPVQDGDGQTPTESPESVRQRCLELFYAKLDVTECCHAPLFEAGDDDTFYCPQCGKPNPCVITSDNFWWMTRTVPSWADD